MEETISLDKEQCQEVDNLEKAENISFKARTLRPRTISLADTSVQARVWIKQLPQSPITDMQQPELL